MRFRELLAPRYQRLAGDLGWATMIGGLCLASAWAGIRFSTLPPGLAMIWPPSGLLLAALLLRPGRAWPPVLLAAGLAVFIANRAAGSDALVSLSFAAVNCAESALAAWALRRALGAPPALTTLRDVVTLLAVAAFGANALTAFLGATIPALAYGAPFWLVWQRWWLADGLGMIVVGGAILAWFAPGALPARPPGLRIAEAGAALAALLGSAGLIFWAPFGGRLAATPYLSFPALLWFAVRFGPRGASAAAAALAAVVMGATLAGRGPFSDPAIDVATHLIEVQLFLGVTAICALLLAAVTAERAAIARALQRTHDSLDTLVAERTAALEASNRRLQAEIAERAQAEAATRFQAQLLNTVNQAVIATDLAGRITYWNRYAETLYGWAGAEALGRDVVALVPAEMSQEQAAALMESLAQGESWSGEFLVRRRDGHTFPALVTDSPVYDAEGRQVGVVGISVDISDRKRAEAALRDLNAALEQRVAERTAALLGANYQLQQQLDERARAERALRESERRFRAIFDATFQFIGLLSPDGTLLEANQTALDFGGLTREAVVGRPFWEARWWGVAAETQARLREAIAAAGRGQFVRYEEEVLGGDDRLATIDFSLKPVFDEHARVVLLIPEGRDITARKQAERQLNASLAEKEALLREVHHRVKNNLQVVTSLLRLQSRQTADLHAAMVLRESQQRVEVMALVHELLYRGADLAQIDAAVYLRRLIDQVQRIYDAGQRNVQLRVQVEPITFSVDTAIPCGLILHELLSNSFKHAFPEGQPGTVGVELDREGAERLRLRVWDTGVGLARPAAAAGSLGLHLVQALGRQLRAQLDFQHQAGTRVTITFPSRSAAAAQPSGAPLAAPPAPAR